jgi:hypothetical protein
MILRQSQESDADGREEINTADQQEILKTPPLEIMRTEKSV